MTIQTSKSPIANYHQVEDWFFRGAQPREEGLAYLAEQGIGTVINLRWKGRDVNWEKEIVEKSGMKFIHIALNYWTLPRADHFDEFLHCIDDVAQRPVFVHCYHGADRTGLFVALYRIARCGWTLERAYQEMVDCGFHRFRTRHFKWALILLAAYARQRHAAYCRLVPE